MLTITHTHEAGTIIDGTSKGDGTAEILKANRWRWGRSIGAWFVPNSRDHLPKSALIEGTAAALREAGFEVTTEIDATHRSTAEVEAGKIERQAARVDALDAKAERKQSDATPRGTGTRPTSRGSRRAASRSRSATTPKDATARPSPAPIRAPGAASRRNTTRPRGQRAARRRSTPTPAIGPSPWRTASRRWAPKFGASAAVSTADATTPSTAITGDRRAQKTPEPSASRRGSRSCATSSPTGRRCVPSRSPPARPPATHAKRAERATG